MKQKLGLAVATVCVGMGTLVGPASTAVASPADTGGTTAAQRSQAAGVGIMAHVDRVNVPKCVKFKTNFSGYKDHLYIKNKCKRAKHVKVILDQASDFECRKISKGHTRHYWWSYPAKVNKVKGC
ncbi:hypothetical protein ACWC5C_22465 [Streptomyces sp. NPDC001700]